MVPCAARKICFGRRPVDAFCRVDREPKQDDTTMTSDLEELSAADVRHRKSVG
jgi:hypothetical protein